LLHWPADGQNRNAPAFVPGSLHLDLNLLGGKNIDPIDIAAFQLFQGPPVEMTRRRIGVDNLAALRSISNITAWLF
jgi:hypothetical protein